MPDKNRSPRSPGLLSRIKSIFGLNIGTMLFGVLLLYMIFSAILYLTSDKVESYQVISGPLSRNETYTGLAVREESVYKADTDGYITYYAKEGNKINANGVIYGIGSTMPSDNEAELTAEEILNIRNDMMSFSKSFNSSKFNNTYSFKYNLEGNILQYAGSSQSGVTTLGGQKITKTDRDGIVLYSMDGYEDKTVSTLTAADFDQNAYHETDLKNDGSIQTGDPVYTLITDERWSLLIPLSSKQEAKLADRTAVRVKFLKDDMTQSGDFSIVEIEGQKYGKIDFNKGLIRYAADRFLEIELVTNTVTGLKIPLSSIVTKEAYKIPDKYLTTDPKTQKTGLMIEGSDKNGNSTSSFVPVDIYARTEDEEAMKAAQKEAQEKMAAKNSDEGAEAAEVVSVPTQYLYFVDKKGLQEGDVAVCPEDQSRFVIKDIGVLEGVYCTNQGYAVFRHIELLDQNEEYAIVSKNTVYGLSRYDHIVRNADKVSEQEILY
ncbi:HlyD family efflux transporter periplasmic adaptor subunit [uncultured Blautia sp.]|uniref:HlyD family efflux transporter periplasmic adaptor subunit n=1 Tax=uncultured Blautia sp. TaxID=765821 RepID=UPI00280AD037|nr:HlyD family efflux transporter periplasmic adaptor subunit [uncultured Blautia sp.]